jgi:N-carbamoylputrescine amidase
MPSEPGAWEAAWFARGTEDFGVYEAGALRFGLNICTELWALETYDHYARASASMVVAPRATAASTIDKWLAIGTVGAVRAGAYSVSSNRVHPDGSCGGVGWIIDPDGRQLALTSEASPFATIDLDLDAPVRAASTYPRYALRA